MTVAGRSLARLVPGVDWLAHYRRASFKKDLLGGLTAGSVVIPQAMAYASIANLPAEVGLYTCMVPMVVYALLGGSRTLSVSTTSTVAVLTGSTLIAADVAANSDDPARALATLTMLVGTILVLARLARLGSIVDNISQATLTGIKVGVGLTVAVGQIPALLGIDGDPTADNFFGTLKGVLEDLDDISWTTAALAGATLVVLFAIGHFAPSIPGPLIGVAMGIVSVAVLSLDDHGVALIAPVPSGLPLPVVPELDLVKGLLGGACAIAVMCFLETASVAGSVRRPEEPAIDNDQELAANGLVCLIGGVFRAMPSAGGFSQTAINLKAGAVTQVSGLVTAALAVACALLLGDVLSKLPQATLGCLVLIAVLGLIRPAEFKRFWRLDRIEFWVAVITAVSGLVLGLLAAVLVGVVLTLFLVLRELSRIGYTELQPTNVGDDLQPPSEHTTPVPGLLVVRIDGPLYTANVRSAHRKLLEIVDQAHPDTVVIDASAQGALSVSVLAQFPDLERELERRGATLWITALPPRTLEAVRLTPRWDDFVSDERLYPTALAAVRAYRSKESGNPDLPAQS